MKRGRFLPRSVQRQALEGLTAAEMAIPGGTVRRASGRPGSRLPPRLHVHVHVHVNTVHMSVRGGPPRLTARGAKRGPARTPYPTPAPP